MIIERVDGSWSNVERAADGAAGGGIEATGGVIRGQFCKGNVCVAPAFAVWFKFAMTNARQLCVVDCLSGDHTVVGHSPYTIGSAEACDWRIVDDGMPSELFSVQEWGRQWRVLPAAEGRMVFDGMEMGAAGVDVEPGEDQDAGGQRVRGLPHHSESRRVGGTVGSATVVHHRFAQRTQRGSVRMAGAGPPATARSRRSG